MRREKAENLVKALVAVGAAWGRRARGGKRGPEGEGYESARG